MPKKLPLSFYLREDVCQIARDLLGTCLMTEVDGLLCGGMIVETEAYKGMGDRACHAYNGRRTSRNEVMYQEGGLAYVYLCYGIHHLFNVVTNVQDRADAVLVRGLEPLEGISHMLDRRGMQKARPRLTAGPGNLSKALGITTSFNGNELNSDLIWVEERQAKVEYEILERPRVGVDYAGEDALLPWRYSIKGNRWVSGKKSEN